ncbi:hypothetical protein [Helicobacter sp. 23-1046]
MKKFSVMFFVAVLSIAFVACGDSKDSHESQTLDSNESQIESSDLARDSSDLNAQSSESTTDSHIDSSKSTKSLAWEKADCDFLMKLWGITKERCDMLDSSPDIATIEAKNIEQAYQRLLLDDDYWTLKIKEFLLSELPMKNHTHTDKLTSEGVEKYTTTYKWKDEKTLEIHIQHPDDCTDDYYIFFDLGNGRVKIMRNQETC